MKRDELNPIKLSIILFLIAGFSGLILSIVYSTTQPVILEYERQKERESLAIIMPAADSFKQEEDHYIMYNKNKDLVGYVFKTSSRGYGGKVKCIVGIDLAGKITGLVVASHSETPGLGSRIQDVRKGEKRPYFQTGFNNLKEEDLDFNNIKSITGATVSSKAVLECAKQAFVKLARIR